MPSMNHCGVTSQILSHEALLLEVVEHLVTHVVRHPTPRADDDAERPDRVRRRSLNPNGTGSTRPSRRRSRGAVLHLPGRGADEKECVLVQLRGFRVATGASVDIDLARARDAVQPRRQHPNGFVERPDRNRRREHGNEQNPLQHALHNTPASGGHGRSNPLRSETGVSPRRPELRDPSAARSERRGSCASSSPRTPGTRGSDRRACAPRQARAPGSRRVRAPRARPGAAKDGPARRRT